MRFQTWTPTVETTEHKWYVIDATDMNLGRLCSHIANILRGKHKPTYAPHQDTGDFVIVLNAGKITVTGNRLDEKFYYRHSQYPGGFRQTALRDLLRTHPERAIESGVWGMLPKGRLGRQVIKKLKVYKGNTHPHESQKPIPMDVPEAKKSNG